MNNAQRGRRWGRHHAGAAVVLDAGKSNLLQLIDAERSYEQARLGDGRAVAQRYQDVAQLAVGMGGGWWQIPESARLNWGQS